MQSPSQIASASRGFSAHLLAGFVAPAWTGPAPVLSEVPGADQAGDALCVWLYHVAHNSAWRNAGAEPTRRSPDGRASAAEALDLHYLVCANTADPARAQHILERACLRLHAEPLVPAAASGLSRPLVFAPVSRSPAELLALWQALRLPPRPALGYQATVVL